MAEDDESTGLRNLILSEKDKNEVSKLKKDEKVRIRYAYKERWLKEKAVEKEKEKKNHFEVLQRSAARFSNSPFAVNFLGLEEIREHNRKYKKKTSKIRKNSKPKQTPSQTREEKFLSKLRNEVKMIENSILYLAEKKLQAATKDKHQLSFTIELSKKSKQPSKESESFSAISKGIQSFSSKAGHNSYMF